MRISRALWVSALAWAFCAAVSAAQLPFNGPEFRVNSYTPDIERLAAVAADSEGDFVVVWGVCESPSQCFPASIRARQFDRHGNPLGDDFQVNSGTAATYYAPGVAVEPGGNFLVAWDGPGVRGRVFDSDGQPLGPEFSVSEPAYPSGRRPSVASAGQGFVVVWESEQSPGPDTTKSVQARRFDRNGSPLGGQFQVNTYTYDWQYQADVAGDAQGRFIVVWQGPYAGEHVWGQLFDANGSPLGGEFQVDEAYGFRCPSVAMDASGSFLVVWGPVPKARWFDADGVPLGGEFSVDEGGWADSSPAAVPDVSLDPLGNALVAWVLVEPSGVYPNSWSIKSRYFPAGGEPAEPLVVNAYTSFPGGYPVIASTPNQGFVVVWSGSDAESNDILARRLGDLFSDGFESGDTSRWSGAMP